MDTSVARHLVFRDLPPGWVVALVAVPLLLAFLRIVYGSGPGPRRTLAWLRAAALIALGLVLARPAWETVHSVTRRTPLIVLLDDSASMRRRDAYSDEEREALAKAAQLAGPAAVPGTTRAGLVAGVVDGGLLDGAAQGADVRLFAFSNRTRSIGRASEATGSGDATALGDAIRSAVGQHRGRFPAAIVVLTDGRSTAGSDPVDAARAAAAAQVPVHVIGVGDARVPDNWEVHVVEAPDVVLERDEVLITVRVTASGRGGSAPIVLERVATGEVLDEDQVRIEGGQDSRVTLSYTPIGAGEERLRVRIPPQPDETLTDDNEDLVTLRVRPERIRVLYVENAPRWEYRYLRGILLRADQNLRAHCFLLEATRDFIQEATPGLTPLERVPTTTSALMDAFDVVILGDVDPYHPRLARTPAEAARFLEALEGFVEGGGGLLVVAGPENAPHAYAGTPLARLLPVDLGPAEEDLGGVGAFVPRLGNALAPHESVRLVPDAEANRALWTDGPGGLAAFEWYARVAKPKPGAVVALRHPEDSNRYGPRPILAFTRVPDGRTGFLATDETWRWRLEHPQFQERFWRQTIRWLALGRLRLADRRHRIETDRSLYELGERVEVTARILDHDFAPIRDESATAFLAGPDGRHEISLDRAGDGLFKANLAAETTGPATVFLAEGDDPSSERVAEAAFDVVLPRRETRDPRPDTATMAAMADAGGGLFVPLARAGEVARLFDGLQPVRERLAARREDIWDRAWVLVLIVSLLAAEWALRKRSHLV